MKNFISALLLGTLGLTLAGCPPFGGGTSDDSEGEAAGEVTQREREVSGQMAIALGGVAEGTDEILVSEDFRSLDFETEDTDLIGLEPLEGFSTFAEGSGARVLPQAAGIAYVTPVVDGRERDPIEVIIPPQKLIQILVGEARGEMAAEATLDGEGNVKETSVSVTGDAVGAVIRNRINLINEMASPSLFNADPDAYEGNPPVSYYEAVIEAERDGVYQFAPVDPAALSNDVYLDAAGRENLSTAAKRAYDQALLTAAYIFSEDTEDPTGEAFGFYSPDESEYTVLAGALQSETATLPEGAGKSDASFPTLAPIQILFLDEIASNQSAPDLPSFVFVRSRHRDDPAVTDVP